MPPNAAHESAEVQVGTQGRIVLPAGMRRALGIEPGDRLVLRREGDRLVLERRETVLARLRARFADVPPERNLADELIRERRAEAAREADGQ